MNEVCIWLLNINYDNVVDVVYESYKAYAKKIGADLKIINERLNPDWHLSYERTQVFEKGKQYKWNLVFDSDVLLHKNFPDLTKRINKYSVGLKDNFSVTAKFKTNKYFIRDTRNIGISSVFIMASFYCHDVFEPLLGKQEDYINEIILDPEEIQRGIKPEHFIMEYCWSHNLAKYGLKYQGILSQDEYYTFYHPYGWRDTNNIFHSFTTEEKIQNIKSQIEYWKRLQ